MPESNSKPSLPTGVVTLLFTDIAGSSRLWEQHGDRFIPVWQSHDAVLRDAITRFGGYEVKSEGDAFMIAFSDAADALHCALFAQAALARYPWPPDIGPLQVRMGLHTGEPFVHGNDYFGPMVNRAANTCKAGHGGQVLLTDETRRRAANRLDPKIEFTDLGDCRLKDMGTPQAILQAQHPSVEARAFPPPRTLDGQPNNLPIQRTSFVGRAKEIEQIAAYLAQGEKPILTLTGPGGIGKTRLSLQAAAAYAEWFPDGVWYVRLVEARDVVGAAAEIASAMSVPLDPDRPTLPQVREWLAHRRCLLILDDAGTVSQADGLLRDLLSGSSGLRCLATARESLQIDEAADLAIAGLSTVPDTSQVATENNADADSNPLTQSEAGRLFLERAGAVNPNLKLSAKEAAAAERLLRELEGAPVSIERAAQMMDRVPPSVVLEWLSAQLTPERVPPKASPGVAKFKGLLRSGAQKVGITVETTKTLASNLGHLLQGRADIATDRRDAQQAADLGRESLRLSQEAGNDLGVAAALRQLARIKWQQGDRQSAVVMLAAAAQVYRRYDAPDGAEAQRELEDAREQLGQAAESLPLAPSYERAVALAMDEDGA